MAGLDLGSAAHDINQEMTGLSARGELIVERRPRSYNSLRIDVSIGEIPTCASAWLAVPKR